MRLWLILTSYHVPFESYHTQWLTFSTLRFWAPYGGVMGNVHCSSLDYCKARSGLPIRVNLIFSLGVTAEALRATIGHRRFWKGGSVSAKFSRSMDVSGEPFLHEYIGQWMPYNFVADSIYAKKLRSRLPSSEGHFLTENGHFAFLTPRRFLSDGVSFLPKFHVEGVAPTNHSSCQKTGINGIRMWTQVSFVLSQCTHLADRQTEKTDGRTERPWKYRASHYM